MQWVGILVLALSLTHAILCAWALHQAPAWSLNSPRRLASIGFLLVNYRPSCWWFGMVILIRGPLLSMGQVVAPSVGAVQLLSMSCVILSSLCLQTWFLPWKVPLVNLVDTVSTSLFLMLLGVALHLTPPTGSHSYLDAIGTVLYYLSLGIILFVALLCFMLVAWDYCLKRTSHPRFINLRQLPNTKRMLSGLEAVASNLAGRTDQQKELLVRTGFRSGSVLTISSTLSVYDIFVVEQALELLSIDCGLNPPIIYKVGEFARESFAMPSVVIFFFRQTCLRSCQVNQLTGESYPVGMHLHSWAAAFATSAVARILLEEKFGYNVKDMAIGYSTLDGMYALAGCSTPLNINDPGCADGMNMTYSHVAMESWLSSWLNSWDVIQEEYPATAPRSLGSMGYHGRVSSFISETVRETAWEHEGLNLDFYRGYNVTWHNAARYFDGPQSLNTSLLKRCNETRLMLSRDMKIYVEFTGDWDGVDVVNETVLGKCFDGYFWYPPSCRHDPRACFIYITGGNGWEIDGAMQKASAWNIPMACATAVDYARLPLQHNAMFYWWVPDPSFLSLSPVEVVFPAYDRLAFERGDKRLAVTSELVEILVSQDLQMLAPYVYNFLDSWDMSLSDVNKMLEDEMQSTDDWHEVACRWLLGHGDIWKKWLPYGTQCLQQFGLYNTVSRKFVDNREDPSDLTCEPCPAGTYSKELVDDAGTTWICVPCPLGTAQASGASLECEACSFGTYQDELGSVACKRCDFGDYQDEKGQDACKSCPPDTTTLGLGSVIRSDCGCNEGHININSSGLDCAKCSEGLLCPTMSKLDALKSGYSDLGSKFTPSIQEGYFSTKSAPMEVYRCFGSHCPGGLPGNCSGGTEGPTCDRCPANMYMASGECTSCGAYKAAEWIVGTIVLLLGLLASYYITEKHYIARGSLFESGKLVMELVLNSLQNLGILSYVIVPWPVFLRNLFDFSTIFALNLKSLGMSCAVNTDLGRYIVVVIFFASIVILMPCLGCITHLLPSLTKRGWNWTYYGTICALGKILSSLFVTMCSIGIVPFICLSHPNKRYSISHYPNTLCGTTEHSTMQWVGVLLLALSLTHAILCAWALHQAPAWSLSSPQRLTAIGFLLVNYRPSCWWFSMVILIRAPLLSVGQVIAPSVGAVQLLSMSCVILYALCLQTWFLPWKIPLVNLVDTVSTSLFLMLLGVALHLTPPTASRSYLDVFGTGLYYLNLGIILLVALLCFTLVAWDFCMKRTSHVRFMNLRRLPATERLLSGLEAVASNLAGRTDQQKELLVRTISSTLLVYDIFVVEQALELLSIDCGLGPLNLHYSQNRIAAKRGSRSRHPESLDKRPVTAVEAIVTSVLRPVICEATRSVSFATDLSFPFVMHPA
eukprot:s9_g22.t1